ncbi:MAG: FecR domain-containing protein [Bacteroidetes bacterium]|nr:FecR domain-containing protein [Bacteroidota bacterium]
MEKETTYQIDLITRYLAGEAGSDDLVFLEAWLKADPGNRKIFENYRLIWLEMERTRMENSVDVDAAWKDMESLIGEEKVHGTGYTMQGQEFPTPEREEGQTKTRSLVQVYYRQALRIAAVLILVAVPSFFVFRYFSRPVQKQMDATLTLKEGKLPDGTSVTLNKGSVLEYPSFFKGKKRNVKLNGEAYFEVKHDDKKPFIISNGNVRVEVLGTSFYVNTQAASNTMEVILNSGSVAVYFEGGKENPLILKPGEKAEILPDQQTMEKDINTNPNYNSWMTQRFVYSNTPLLMILADLNKVYHTDLRITTPAISYCLVTATFDHQSPEAILHVLQATLDLTISSHGTWTGISGKKCN